MRDDRWSPALDAALLGLHAEGFSMAQIGLELNRSRSAVSGRIARLRAGPVLRLPRAKRPYERRVTANDARRSECTRPFQTDNSCPRFAHDAAHVSACRALGGFPVLTIQRRR